MDQDRFENLTRALATATTRRQALKTLAGGAAGGLLALLGMGEASAAGCQKTGKKCKAHKECCSGNCVNGVCCAGLFQPCEHDADCCGGICDLYSQEPGRTTQCLQPCDPNVLGSCPPGAGSFCCNFGGQFACANQCPA